MLVVLDAGMFVSTAITPGGVASRIVIAGIEGRFEYLLCPKLVGELTDVLGRPKIVRMVTRRTASALWKMRWLPAAMWTTRPRSPP